MSEQKTINIKLSKKKDYKTASSELKGLFNDEVKIEIKDNELVVDKIYGVDLEVVINVARKFEGYEIFIQ